MKQRLLAIAALVAAGSGLIVVSWNAPTEVLPDSALNFGRFEVGDPNLCTRTACNTNPCRAAENHLRDGGYPTAEMRIIECDVRLGQDARNQAADAGSSFPAGKYHRVQFVGMRIGNALGIAVDDAGWPVHGLTRVAHPCRKKPTEGAACTTLDGGDPGILNTGQPGQLVGSGCVETPCSVIAGDPE